MPHREKDLSRVVDMEMARGRGFGVGKVTNRASKLRQVRRGTRTIRRSDALKFLRRR